MSWFPDVGALRKYRSIWRANAVESIRWIMEDSDKFFHDRGLTPYTHEYKVIRIAELHAKIVEYDAAVAADQRLDR